MVVIGREEQIETLSTLANLNSSHQCLPLHASTSLITLYGAPATGKSVVLRDLLNKRSDGIMKIFINCKFISTQHDLYCEILTQTKKYLQIFGNNAKEKFEKAFENQESFVLIQEDAKENGMEDDCTDKLKQNGQRWTHLFEMEADSGFGSKKINFMTFYRIYVKLLDSAQGLSNQLYLGLDHVDVLIDKDLTCAISCLLRLNDQFSMRKLITSNCDWKLCLILVTRAIAPGLLRVLSPFSPAYVYFPPYNKFEIARILSEELQVASEHVSVFQKWIVKVAERYIETMDWYEVRRVAIWLLPTFLAAQETERASKKLASEALMKATHCELKKLRQNHHKTPRSTQCKGNLCEKLESMTNDFKALPVACRLLLIASFLASYTPQEKDNLFVSSTHDKLRKKRKHTGKGSEVSTTVSDPKTCRNQLLMGPRPFALQRLYAIYYSISAEYKSYDGSNRRGKELDSEDEVSEYILILQRMNMVQRVSSIEKLDQISHRCLVTWERIKALALTLDFPIKMYILF